MNQPDQQARHDAGRVRATQETVARGPIGRKRRFSYGPLCPLFEGTLDEHGF